MQDQKVKEVEQIIDRYKKLYPGLIYDTLAELGYPNQVCSLDIKPLRDDMVLAGPAFTMKGRSSDEKFEEGVQIKKLLSMVNEMSYPSILVIDTGGDTRCAHHGELLAISSRAHGTLGALIDGGTRDSRFLLEMDYPVFSRYQNPIELQGRYEMEYCQKPVQMRGTLTEYVTVNPGDFIFGDIDGILVIPKEMTLKVLEKAEEYLELESLGREDLEKGVDPVKVWDKYEKI